MSEISDEDFTAVLNKASSIVVDNGETMQNVDGWLLKPCEDMTFKGNQVTPTLIQDLFRLQGLGLIHMTVKVSTVELEFPLINNEFHLNETKGEFEPWQQRVKV